MKLFTAETEVKTQKKVVLDDMILTKDLPTCAGSKMLDGYMSLFDAQVVTKLSEAQIGICGKANVGEFAIDLLGETSYYGACTNDGKLVSASAEIVKTGKADAAIVLDVNGAPRRAAAQSDLVYIKPTYGTVSRYGTIPAACSGETVGVISTTANQCKEILGIIAGHDDKDGTSHADTVCQKIKTSSEKITKIALISAFNVDSDTAAKIDNFKTVIEKSGVSCHTVEGEKLLCARVAWNILMSAELCNNVSRYDGIKYGHRASEYTTIGELYTNSRTEAFGDLLKTAILYGSDTLSTENYMKVYDKALRIRRVVAEYFDELFKEYDAVLLPGCSKSFYTEKDIETNKYISFEENACTAPASITGLPAVVAGGVQIVGKAFSDAGLLDLAEIYEKGGK
ncbi:MAG: hypothetical protein IJO74_07465 [Clostridia bacterium]|nr:hypothetical protein [Clostridia bacterium]